MSKKCPFKTKGRNIFNLGKNVCKLQTIGVDDYTSSGLITTGYRVIYGNCIGEDKCPIIRN